MRGPLALNGSGTVLEEEVVVPPRDADAFARIVIRAICGASVEPRVGRLTYERCLRALASGSTARLGFRHPGKADAVDRIWRDRHAIFRGYLANADRIAFLAELPWIGPATRRVLARQLGEPEESADERRSAA